MGREERGKECVGLLSSNSKEERALMFLLMLLTKGKKKKKWMCCVLADVSSIMFGRWFLCFLSLICPKRTGDKQGRMIMTVQVSLVRHFENFQTRFPVLLGKKKKGMSESLRSHSKILLRGKFSKG